MPHFIAFLQSLLVASTISFVTPLGLIGLSLFGFWLMEQISLVATIHASATVTAIARSGFELIVQFLVTFGGGNALQGALVIGATCCLVGALFDTYAFYRQHHLGRS